MKLVEEFAAHLSMLDSDFFDPGHVPNDICKIFNMDFRVMETKYERVDIRRSGDDIRRSGDVYIGSWGSSTGPIEVKFAEHWNDKAVKTTRINPRSIIENL